MGTGSAFLNIGVSLIPSGNMLEMQIISLRIRNFRSGAQKIVLKKALLVISMELKFENQWPRKRKHRSQFKSVIKLLCVNPGSAA